MLKRPGELISQSNFKQFHTASDTYRSLHSFCNSRAAWSLESEVWSRKNELVFDSRLQTPDSRLSLTGDKSY
jgi:hypothetical protein